METKTSISSLLFCSMKNINKERTLNVLVCNSGWQYNKIQ